MSIGAGLSRSSRLWMVLGLNLALVGLLIAVGIAAHSLGVLAEGADYLADAAAIGVSLLAIWLSGRPPTSARPGGYPKATAWAALVNGCWLLVLTVLVSATAIYRLVAGTHEVHGLPVLIVSSIAALVMVVGALILGGDEEDEDDHGGNSICGPYCSTRSRRRCSGQCGHHRCHHPDNRWQLLVGPGRRPSGFRRHRLPRNPAPA